MHPRRPRIVMRGHGSILAADAAHMLRFTVRCEFFIWHWICLFCCMLVPSTWPARPGSKTGAAGRVPDVRFAEARSASAGKTLCGKRCVYQRIASGPWCKRCNCCRRRRYGCEHREQGARRADETALVCIMKRVFGDNFLILNTHLVQTRGGGGDDVNQAAGVQLWAALYYVKWANAAKAAAVQRADAGASVHWRACLGQPPRHPIGVQIGARLQRQAAP